MNAPQSRSLLWIKGIAIAAIAAITAIGGTAFYQHRNHKEAVVLGPGVTSVKKLSDYFPPLKNGPNDCNIYILDSGQPGGTLLIFGGTHAEEPATSLTSQVFVENAKPTAGKLIIAIHMNRSASTVTRPGEGYPQFFEIPTAWGTKTYRMGDRCANPLDSWPDPETYVHYPSGQMLAYMDARNTNRAWPGRPDGSLCEQTTFGFMQLIKAEQVDLAIDYHEAELEYPVIGTIVAHQKAQEIAAMVSMDLSASQFRIGMEISPKTLHGLSHREIGDHSNAVGLLFETPEPFLDRVRGITDAKLLLTGQDDFVKRAGQAGLLYWPIDDTGWPIGTRVGRNVATTAKTIETWSLLNPEKNIMISGLPTYDEMVQGGVGKFLKNPDQAAKDRIAYE